MLLLIPLLMHHGRCAVFAVGRVARQLAVGRRCRGQNPSS